MQEHIFNYMKSLCFFDFIKAQNERQKRSESIELILENLPQFLSSEKFVWPLITS
jgi:hypothetical protein